jgi:hypothetical protein
MAWKTTRRRIRAGPSPGTLAFVAGMSAIALVATVLCKACPI